MSKNYYKMPYGPWKGQNVYEVVESEEGKSYVAGSMWGTKEDLSKMEEGTWKIPFGKFKGKLFSNIPTNMQNYFRFGTQDRFNHYAKALSFLNTSKDSAIPTSSSKRKKEYEPSDVVDKYQIIDMLEKVVGHRYSKRTIDNMVWKVGLQPVGTKVIYGKKGRLAVYLKKDVKKLIDWKKGNSNPFSSITFF